MRRLLWPLFTVSCVVVAVGLYLFEPWALWIDKTVNEPIPVPVGEVPQPGDPGAAGPLTSGGAGTQESTPSSPTVLARGELISHEHETTGRVVVLELADKSRVLRLEDLDTSSGPDVEVWITDAPVIEGSDGWHVFDDGDFVELGDLKGNHGNQNYELPASVDLDDLDSVSLWCDRFNVSFGAARLV
jgi:hypothetical protein